MSLLVVTLLVLELLRRLASLVPLSYMLSHAQDLILVHKYLIR